MSLQVAHVIRAVCVIRKALESLAVRDTGDCQRVGERARRDMDALQQAFNKKITDLEQVNIYTFMMYVGLYKNHKISDVFSKLSAKRLTNHSKLGYLGGRVALK